MAVFVCNYKGDDTVLTEDEIVFILPFLFIVCLLLLIISPFVAREAEANKLKALGAESRLIKIEQGCQALNLSNRNYYLIRYNDILCFSEECNLDKITASFELEEIKGYTILSQLQHKNISIGKAIVGGMICGPIGAILGGFMGENKNQYKVVLVLSKYDEEYIILLNKVSFESLKQIIPEKEVYSTSELQKPKAPQSSIVNTIQTHPLSIAEQLEKLATLKEQGVLTEEEFNSQKQKLLN